MVEETERVEGLFAWGTRSNEFEDGKNDHIQRPGLEPY